MKILLLITLCFTSPLIFATIVISDLDDTIKMTNVANPTAAARNVLLSTKVFEPMPELLKEMDKYSSGTHIVSASPKLLNPRIIKLLAKHEIPYKSLHTRGLRDLMDKKAFKLRVIQELITGHEEVILIGDNTQADQEIYKEVVKRNPAKNFFLYIHQVGEQEISAPAIAYFTAFDIAVNEYKNKRMNYYQVAQVAGSLLKQISMESVMSSFGYCPTVKDQFARNVPLELRPLSLPVRTRILQYCKQRNQQ